MDHLPKLITDTELAETLHMSKKTLRRRLELLPHIRPIRGAGATLLFTTAEAGAIIEAQRMPSAAVDSATETRAVVAEGRSPEDAVRALRRRRTKASASHMRSGNVEG